ncbi:MAG: NAD+ synthase [Anaerolineales bacterium]|nr:NAD+ synthase [Anaerolineales bacterium]
MRKLNLDKTIDLLVAFIRETVSSTGLSRVVLNLSGGIDSATSLSLAVKALSPQDVFVLMQPHGDWHQEAVKRSWALLEHLQVPTEHVSEINISPIVEAFTSSIASHNLETTPDESDKNLAELRLGNIMARIRMVFLFDRAKTLNALVLGTENKTEHYLGYYTRFGDEASDIEPLRSLYKTEVYPIARHLGVPTDTLEVAPTAGLWPGQTDEGEFGFTYEEADQVLHGLFDLHLSAEELEDRGLSREIVAKITNWVERMEFKHHLPYQPPEPVEM